MFQTRQHFCRAQLFLNKRTSSRRSSISKNVPIRQPAASSSPSLAHPMPIAAAPLSHLLNSRNCSLQQKQQFSRICPRKRQHHHFCTTTITPIDGCHHPDNSLTESAIRVDKLEERLFQLGPNKEYLLKIELQQCKKEGGGQKHFRIVKFDRSLNFDYTFPDILVPNDARTIVQAMDQLIEEFAKKLSQAPRVCDKIVFEDNEVKQMLFVSRQVSSAHQQYDFRLDVFPYEGHKRRTQFAFEMCTTTGKHQQQGKGDDDDGDGGHHPATTDASLWLPFRALPWLRQQMADMLARHDDGSKQLPAAPQISREMEKFAT